MNDRNNSPKIVVIGVGDGGTNTVDRMAETGVKGVQLVAVDTDRQALDTARVQETIPIGQEITGGTGTGGDVESGAEAAREAQRDFAELAQDADMVFLTSGFGGGTGTGATPVIASTIAEMNVLTVGVITTPFPFEGAFRRERADRGIVELEKHLDALIVVSNAKLLENLPQDISIMQAFRTADDVLQRGVQAISDLITYPGLINLDLADVRNVLKGVGKAIIGIGQGQGSEKTLDAAKAASSNPLLEEGSIKGARRLILNITGGEDLTLTEVKVAAELVKNATGVETNMILGAVVKEDMDESVQVTVIATDFHEGISEEEMEPDLAEEAVDVADMNVPAFIRKRQQEGDTD
ncbi:MAG: cell division protein FtsZ [Candidatus Bipolaricaulota bacterium]